MELKHRSGNKIINSQMTQSTDKGEGGLSKTVTGVNPKNDDAESLINFVMKHALTEGGRYFCEPNLFLKSKQTIYKAAVNQC